MEGDEYPKAMYRDGGPDLIWGEAIETITVQDSSQEEGALADGWRLHPFHRDRLHPLDHDGDGEKGGSLKRRGRPPKVKSDERD